MRVPASRPKVGIVLGAGMGSRLGDLVADCPKTLLEIDGNRTILDVILANFAGCGVEDAVVVAGYRIERLLETVPHLEKRHRLTVTVVANPCYGSRNNCYSLWLARHWFGGDVLVANGDTLHHPGVEHVLLEDRSDGQVVLAVERGGLLGDEEMKVAVGGGRITALGKALDCSTAFGEYIGVALIRRQAGDQLVRSLEEVAIRSSHLYYEDAFQRFADAGGAVTAADIGDTPWTEVDTPEDLKRARDLACLC